jgi:hypothetical protein
VTVDERVTELNATKKIKNSQLEQKVKDADDANKDSLTTYILPQNWTLGAEITRNSCAATKRLPVCKVPIDIDAASAFKTREALYRAERQHSGGKRANRESCQDIYHRVTGIRTSRIEA